MKIKELSKEQRRFANKYLKKYILKEKTTLFLGFVFSILNTLLKIMGPLIIGKLLNDVIRTNMVKEDYLNILKYLGLYFVVYVLSSLFTNFSFVKFEEASNNIRYLAQWDLFKHVQELPISYFDQLPAGSIVSRITNDTSRMQYMFQLLFSDLATALILALAMFGMILYRNPLAGLLLSLLFPVVYLIFWDLRRKTGMYSSRIRQLTSLVNASINENIQNIEIIQSFHEEDQILEDFHEVSKEIITINDKFVKLRGYGGYRAMDIINYIATLVVFVYFGFGQITKSYPVNIGSLYIILDYTSKLFQNLSTIISSFGNLEQYYASAVHTFELFQMEPEEKNENILRNSKGPIEFSHITFAYDREDVLKDINFKVNHGESLAFVGSTGSGKSTIINLLLQFYTAQKGSITIDGQEISRVNKKSLRENMAVILQEATLFETTIRENIKLDEDFSDEEIIEALKVVGAESILKRGLDLKVRESAGNLSQGEQQLVSFARAYIRDPDILIMDEATSNIDTETESLIQQGIHKLRENRTTFIIAHRLSTIQDLDHIIVLDQGRIIEEGTHEELLNLKGFYYKMYISQIEEE